MKRVMRKKPKGFKPGSNKGLFNADGTVRHKANQGRRSPKNTKHGKVRKR